ncbi:MAG TPA: ATP synthase subunit I [Acidimicrobiales bacterium]
MTSTFVTRDLGPAPEPVLALDIAKRALAFAPVAIAVCAAIWGAAGATSAAYAMAIVLANLAFAAWMLATAARISYGALMGAALFGFLIRLALVSAAVLLVRDAGWVEPVALGLTLVVAHLGLLFWELRFVSISLAHPDLKPTLPKETSPR